MTDHLLPPDTTLESAKEWLRDRLHDGAACPCCTQFAKVYRRSINSSMAHSLIQLYKAVGVNSEYGHLPTITRMGGDSAKLAYWELIEQQPGLRDDGSWRVGWWRPTELAGAWINHQLLVPKYAYVYAQRLMRLDLKGPRISIDEALGTRFNYADLMAS